MKTITLILGCLLISMAGISQTNTKDTTTGSNAIFYKVEQSSSFPGGLDAWREFLNKNLRFPEEALAKVKRKGKRWDVMVSFTVTKEGKLKNIEALTNFGLGLEDEAIRVMRKSPDWIPAQQGGRPVTSYVRQPIVFLVEADR